ncbi:hypothetical protein AVEN_164893-1 [Araneus ventricosus]|uniref:Histone-lysine N-methyltransferase SETMAR n=1 Tax=Araneus ventricosus TaxID=182803 RepID=A0A4Y2DVV7_ARAVE|nr:hypothetical protein AVEN_164893-1 [Araneus ventricosus]
MQERGESLMGQVRGCRLGDPISLILGNECLLLCPFLRPRTKPLTAYCHSCSPVISVRSLDTHFHLFPALKPALSGRHYPSNEEVQQAVKNFLHSLDTDFYQEDFLKFISLYDKCINVDGEYVEE